MISHHHKTIFIHIPKCGGQSVERVYLNDLGLNWENRAPLLLRKRTEGEAAPLRLAHLTLQNYLNNHYVSREIYETYYKFAVVRNPYTRIFSLYNYLRYNKKMDFNTFVKKLVVEKCNPECDSYWFFMPQNLFLINSNNKIEVDDLLKLESLDEDWNKVLKATNLNVSRVPKTNVTKAIKGCVNDLDDESIEIINYLYKDDFYLLGYSIK